MTQPQLNISLEQSLGRIQKALLRVYIVGTILMAFYNNACYPGTFVGVCGWAALWPIYIPAMLIRMWIFGGDISMETLCPGPVAGIR